MDATQPPEQRGPEVTAEGLNRCPFCHDGIAVDEDGWVACGRCLSRHHPGCWSEGTGCASCGHTQSLAQTHDETPPAPPRPLSELQAEAWAAFEPEGERGALPAPLADLASLGLASAFRAERAYRAHKEQNQAQEPPFSEIERVDLKLKLYRVHEYALSDTTGDRYRRMVPALAALALFALPILGLLFVTGSVQEDAARLTALAIGALYPFLLCVHMHLVREALRRHEHGQQLARLVARGAPKQTIEDLRDRSRRGWRGLRLQHAAVSLLTAIPGANLLLVLVAPLALRQSLARHLAHEALLDEACPPAPPAPPPADEPRVSARPRPKGAEKQA